MIFEKFPPSVFSIILRKERWQENPGTLSIGGNLCAMLATRQKAKRLSMATRIGLTTGLLVFLLIKLADASEPVNEEEERMSLNQIGQIAIRVHDVDKAVSFYQSSLGMKLLFRVNHMAFFDCGGIRILLSMPETPELDHPSSTIYFKVEDINSAYGILIDRGVMAFFDSTIYFKVEDINSAYGILIDRGVPFDSEPHKIADMSDHELWMAFFRDVDKNVLALMSEIPKN